MKISDTIELNKAVADKRNVLLLLFSVSNPLAQKIHDLAEKIAEDGNKVFLIADIKILGPEQKSWYQADDSYAVISCKDKSVKDRGLLTALCVKGTPSALKINAAFEAA
jgi:hypothetical protein